MAKKPRPGDIIEIQAPWGYGYVAYAGRDESLGDGVYVSPHRFNKRAAPSDGIFDGAWFTFYPLSTVLRARDVSSAIVGRLETQLPLPTSYRNRGEIDSHGRVHTWIITTPSGSFVADTLTPAEQVLPIAQIVSHPTLLDKIATGWRPEQETGEPPVPMPNKRSDDSRRLVDAEYFVYFRARSNADACRKDFELAGYGVDVSRSEYDRSWLLRAAAGLGPAETAESRAADVEAIAKRHGGEYDGFRTTLT